MARVQTNGYKMLAGSGCDECELAAFIDSHPPERLFTWASRARPHRLEAHLAATAELARDIAADLPARGLMSRREACLATLGATIHDLGHVIGEPGHEHDGIDVDIQFEVRHSHRLELWLRLLHQPTLARAVRHSAPQLVIDARMRRATLPQLVVAYADACTDSSAWHIDRLHDAIHLERTGRIS